MEAPRGRFGSALDGRAGRRVTAVAALALLVLGVVLLRGASGLRDEAGDLERHAEVAGARLGASDQRLERAGDELTSLRADLREADDALARYQEELAGLEADIDAVDQEVRPVATTLLDVEAHLVAVASDLDDVTATIDSITATFDQAVAEGNVRAVEPMVDTLGSARAELEDLGGALDASAASLEDLRAEVDGLAGIGTGGEGTDEP